MWGIRLFLLSPFPPPPRVVSHYPSRMIAPRLPQEDLSGPDFYAQLMSQQNKSWA